MSKKTILVVDDTPVNVEILTGILGGTYNIKYATNGICALKSAQRNPPHLILLDIMMPEMDGYEACRRFKENPDTSEIPIIFITAKTERKDIVKGFEIGGQDYVTKPYNPQELCARIQTHLNLQDKNQELHQAITTQNELNQRLIESGMQLLMLAKNYQNISHLKSIALFLRTKLRSNLAQLTNRYQLCSQTLWDSHPSLRK